MFYLQKCSVSTPSMKSNANITTIEPLSKQKDNMNTILLTDLYRLRVILNQLSHKCPSSGPSPNLGSVLNLAVVHPQSPPRWSCSLVSLSMMLELWIHTGCVLPASGSCQEAHHGSALLFVELVWVTWLKYCVLCISAALVRSCLQWLFL